MPEKVTNELLYEVLKNMQTRIDRVETLCKSTHDSVLSLREEVNSMRGDSLRLERHMASIEARLERTEIRLDISDT